MFIPNGGKTFGSEIQHKGETGHLTAVHSTDGLWERLPEVAGLEQTLQTHGGKKGLSIMNEHGMQSLTQTSRSGTRTRF